MKTNENQSKKRYYPLRDAENPKKVTLIEITEEQYRALYPEIWAAWDREHNHGCCICPKKYSWKCDANCDLCEYRAIGDKVYLNEPSPNGSTDWYNAIPDTESVVDEIVDDRILLAKLIARFRELDPDADLIIEMLANDYSGRKIAEALGRKQRTFADQMKRYRTEFRRIRGY